MRNTLWLAALAALFLSACGGGSDTSTSASPAPVAPAPVVPAPSSASIASMEGFYSGSTIDARTVGSSGVSGFWTASILVDNKGNVWASYIGGGLPNFFFYSISGFGVQDVAGTTFTGLGEWFNPGTVVSAFASQNVLGVVQDTYGNWVLSGDQLTVTGSFIEQQSLNARPVATAQFSAGFPFSTSFDSTPPLVVAPRSYSAWISVPGYISISSVPMTVSNNTFSADIGICHISGTFTPTVKNYNYVSMTIGVGCGIPGSPRTFDGVVTPGHVDYGIGEEQVAGSLLMMAKDATLKVMVMIN